DVFPATVEPGEVAFDKGEVGVQSSQLGERGLRFLDSSEFGQTGNYVAQTSLPIPVERPGPPPDLNRLLVMAQLIVRPGQRGQPDEEAWIPGAEVDALFRPFDRLFPPPRIEVHLSEQYVGGGKARVELDCLLERCNPALGTARPHARQTKGKMRVW